MNTDLGPAYTGTKVSAGCPQDTPQTLVHPNHHKDDPEVKHIKVEVSTGDNPWQDRDLLTFHCHHGNSNLKGLIRGRFVAPIEIEEDVWGAERSRVDRNDGREV